MIDVLDEQKKDGPEGDEGGTTKDVDGEATGGVAAGVQDGAKDGAKDGAGDIVDVVKSPMQHWWGSLATSLHARALESARIADHITEDVTTTLVSLQTEQLHLAAQLTSEATAAAKELKDATSARTSAENNYTKVRCRIASLTHAPLAPTPCPLIPRPVQCTTKLEALVSKVGAETQMSQTAGELRIMEKSFDPLT